MFSLAAIKTFFSGKLNLVFLAIIVALSTAIGTQYLSGKAKDSQIANKEKEIQALNKKLGTQETTINQQKATLEVCSKATDDLKKTSDAQTKKANEALELAKAQAQENLDYAKNLAKAMPTVSDDYQATKILMNQLIDRRAGK